MKEMNLKEFLKIKDKGKYVVEFFTDWCSDCKMMIPVIDKIESENKDITFIKINAETSDTFRKDGEFSVLKVPSIFYINDGNKEHLGYDYVPEELLRNKLKDAITKLG